MDYSYLLDKYTTNYDKLLSYGFIKEGYNYIYKHDLKNNMYVLIEITSKKILTSVYDSSLNEEYILYNIYNSLFGFIRIAF